MIIKDTDNEVCEINEAWLRESLEHEARHTGIEVFNPQPNLIILSVGDRDYRLEKQDFTAQLIDARGDTILAAVSEGIEFEDNLARAVIHRIIKCL